MFADECEKQPQIYYTPDRLGEALNSDYYDEDGQLVRDE